MESDFGSWRLPRSTRGILSGYTHRDSLTRVAYSGLELCFIGGPVKLGDVDTLQSIVIHESFVCAFSCCIIVSLLIARTLSFML